MEDDETVTHRNWNDQVNQTTRGGQPWILKLLFVLLVVAALGFIVRQTTLSWMQARQHVEKNIPRLRADLVADLESMGFIRSLRIEEDGSIRFGHPPTMTSDDLILLLRRIMQRFDLIMTAAVNYKERGDLYVELSTREPVVVGRFVFASLAKEAALAEGIVGRIGIIIDDFGYIRNRLTASFMDLKEKITFAIIPGHRFSQILADEADQSGHEVIIHMPMEPEDYNGRDEEEYILLYGMDEVEAIARIRKAFQSLPQAVGMNNHEGSLATLDTVLLAAMARELNDREKYFIDSYTTPETRALEIMKKAGVPSLGRHVFLDNVDEPDYIREQLALLAAKAESNGAAIGIGHVGSSHLNTLDVLAEEIPRLMDRGFEFVFVSELVK